MTNPKSAHFTKHDDKQVVVTETETKVEATGESCGTSRRRRRSRSPRSRRTSVPADPGCRSPVAPVTPAPVDAGTVRVRRRRASNAAPTQSAGGVLGANATIVKPKPAGGVLGTVANVAGSTLPFTGFPVWVALLVALGLIAAGLTAWRRGSAADAHLASPQQGERRRAAERPPFACELRFGNRLQPAEARLQS